MAIQINGTSGISGVDGSAGTPAIQGTDTNTGLTFGTDTVGIVTGGATRATVDSSGRLLVGTTSARSNIYYTTNATTPPIQAEIATNSYSAGMSLLNYSASGYNPSLTLGASSSNTLGTNTALGGSYGLGAINFVGADGTNFRVGASIVAVNDQGGSWASGDCPARLVFSTTADGASSPTERMRINSNGQLLIGTTTENGRGLSLYSQFSGSSGGIAFSKNNDGNANACAFINAGTVIGTISYDTTSTAYNTSSDYRLKENITAVTDGIIRLQQLKPSRFNFIADPDRIVDGFIAHEVQAVVPEAINGEKDAVDDDGNPVYQGIDQSKLVPLLTAALQEAIAKIETLETRLTALEGGINS